MQAIRVDRQKSSELRWLHHLALLGTLAFLFNWMVTTRPPVVPASVERPAVGFLSPPSAPAQEWLPVRVPVRTSVTRDPSPTVAGSPPPIDETLAVATSPADLTLVASVPAVEQWVQAHRRSALLSAPEDGAPREIEVPQWSYLRVLETGDGWLKVAYGSNVDGRSAAVA